MTSREFRMKYSYFMIDRVKAINPEIIEVIRDMTKQGYGRIEVLRLLHGEFSLAESVALYDLAFVEN